MVSEEQEMKRQVIIDYFKFNCSDHLIDRLFELINDELLEQVQTVVH